MARVESMKGAYLDHAASTPLLAEVLEAMSVYLRDQFANPSGLYRAGREARRAVDDARDALSGALGCLPGEIVFTSGGTEADNLAIFGTRGSADHDRVIVSAIEHHAVLRPAQSIGALIAPVTSEGLIDLEPLAAMLDSEVALVSVMAVNNEVGTVQPLNAVVEIVRARSPQALLHCDAVQALQWCDLPTVTKDFDLITVSAHKIGGPKGVGALVVRERARARLHPIHLGGAQERDLRAGTENVAAIVGFSAAAALARTHQAQTICRVRSLRDRFVEGVLRGIPTARETVRREIRHAGSAHLCFPGTDNEELLMLLDVHGIAASAGSACASGALEPSHVLLAMGMSEIEARACIRFSLGFSSTSSEIDCAIPAVIAAHRQLMGDRSA